MMTQEELDSAADLISEVLCESPHIQNAANDWAFKELGLSPSLDLSDEQLEAVTDKVNEWIDQAVAHLKEIKT